MIHREDSRTLAARGWFGYGRWGAPYWFVGMEPGGADDPTWYETWVRLGGQELCDCRAHHLGSNYTRWHVGPKPPTQSTWRHLIQLLLSYLGTSGDSPAGNDRTSDHLAPVRAYQRDGWGNLDGDTALLEVSAIRAQSLATVVDRNRYRESRIAVIGERLKEHRPIFVVFYGRDYKAIYEQIVGEKFQPDGYVWRGSTLCVLVDHPVRRPAADWVGSSEWWEAKGREIALKIKCGVESNLEMTPEARVTSLNPSVGPSQDITFFSRNRESTEEKIIPLRSDVIRVLSRTNPKLVGSKSRLRFDCYKDGMTIEEYERCVRQRLGENEAKKCQDDLEWDYERKHIAVERNSRPVNIWVRPSFKL